MNYSKMDVLVEYATRNVYLLLSKGVDKPLPSDDLVSEAACQLNHFAKQGVKVRLK